ncbi:unnamed protein product, partial [Mesorhabditis belari]|uniref:Mitochondrial import receptor subunit TOM70 n=1 Tax=Mesorhabditis belari TaxID=2138241 RepID=A0AAF3F239_9BILA
MSTTGAGASDVSRRVAIAAAVAAGAIGVGVGLYYLTRKSSDDPNADKKKLEKLKAGPEVDNSKLAQMKSIELKELGNKLFSVKKYPKAIEIFTKAIEKCGEGEEELLAVCFQNRAAAKEYLTGVSLEEIIDDCTKALEHKPHYGKAYVRRAKNEQKNRQYREALVDIFAATHVDPALDNQIGDILAQVSTILAEVEKEEWIRSANPQQQVTPVRHERVYAWLHKIGEHDPIRVDIVEHAKGDGPYYNALQLIRERHYTSVAECAAKCFTAEGISIDEKLKGLLLTARFQALQNQRALAEEIFSSFEKEFDLLIDLEKERLSDLRKSKASLLIEIGRNKDEVLGAFTKAIELDKAYVDFYTTATFRLTQLNDLTDADVVINKSDFEDTVNAKLARHMLKILVAVQSGDMAQVHNGIRGLEEFVNGLPEQTPYALILLAKIYALFQNNELAAETLGKLMQIESEESSHYFDASMLASNENEMMTRLEKCVALEPNHAEANLMLCSLKVNQVGPKALTAKDYDFCTACLDRATRVIVPDSPDFPTVSSVFQMMAILKAKREAGVRFSV